MSERTCSFDGCDRPWFSKGWCNSHYWQARYGREMRPIGQREPQPVRGCSVPGCDRKHYGKGWCDLHWRRVKKDGGPGPVGVRQVRAYPPGATCKVEGCNRWPSSNWLCDTHTRRLRVHGTTDSPKNPAWRFWRKVNKTESCWLWAGAHNLNGYGTFGVDHVHRLAHRYAYELLVGPIPEGKSLDHLCRVRNCVNPAHLEPVTHEENMARRPKSTHCVNGHEWTSETTWLDKAGHRHCLPCRKEYARAAYQRKKAARDART